MSSPRLLSLMVLAGLLGGVIGVSVGGPIVAASCDWNTKEAGCIEPSAYGAIVGATVLMPLGVHLASPLRRHFPPLLLSSLAVGGIAAAGIVASSLSEWILFAVPIMQLIICVVIEWRFARSSLAY